MSSIVRIKENYANYTDAEKRVADYILNHINIVINQSTQTVAEKTNTSPATIVRFSKRLGYEGFTNLKVEIAKNSKSEATTDFTAMIESSDSLETMVYKAEHANINTFNKTYRLLNLTDLDLAIQALTKARRIFVYGVGGAAIGCEDLYHKLLRINVDVVYIEDFHLLLTALTHIQPGDVAIAMSYSGRTRDVIVAQTYAKSKGATTITITSNKKSEVAKQSDYVLMIPREEKEIRLGAIASRFSLLVISDLLYFGMVKQHMVEATQAIIDTRHVLDQLRD